jgi:preprotein translocase subunit SecF
MNLRRSIATFRGHHIPNIDFIGRRRIWFTFSGILVVVSIAGLVGRGLNYSIDFKGGSLLEFPNKSGASVADYQRVLNKYGLGEAQIEILQGTQCTEGCVNIKSKSLTELGLIAQPAPSVPASPSATASPTATAPSPSASPSASASASPSASPSASASASPSTAPAATVTTAKADRLRNELARVAGIDPGEINETDVGPTWGGTISRKAITALIVFLVAVSLYISFRFEPKMAAGALIAMGHDLIITAGIYALVGREVTPETVIAILTILGYSLYDTVVIYDKIKENTETASLVAREGYSGVVNLSLNQTFMRSVNTSLVVLLPIGALLLFGGQTLKDFAFALFIGVASGAYSSIFLAAPVLAFLKERESRYQQIRARLETRAARPGLRTVPAAGELSAGENGEVRQVTVGGSGTQSRPARGGSSARSRPASTATKKKKPQGKPKRRRR